MPTHEPIENGGDMFTACSNGQRERVQAHGDGGADFTLVESWDGWAGLIGAVEGAGENSDRAERCLSIARYLPVGRWARSTGHEGLARYARARFD